MNSKLVENEEIKKEFYNLKNINYLDSNIHKDKNEELNPQNM